MPTVSGGNSVVVDLLPGQTMTITADVAAGIVRFIGQEGADGSAIAASNSVITLANNTRFIGPFLARRRYRIEPSSGTILYTLHDESAAFTLLGRPIGFTAILTDSRGAQIHSDATAKLRQTTYNHFNWGNWRSGSRLFIVEQGVSGNRADQMLDRLQTCIDSGAGHLYLLCGLNDVSQAFSGYTTVNTIGPNQGVNVNLTNVANIAAQFMQYCVQRFISAGGRIVTICLDPGAETLVASQIAALNEYNQRLRDLAELYPCIVLFDLAKEMRDPAASSTTTIRFKSGYAQEASGSGIHEGHLGGYKVGIAFETHIRDNFPAVSFLPTDVNEITTISVLNQLANPLFVTATGGTVGPGGTGTAPGNWTLERVNGGSGTQTATISVQATSDGGPGNEVVVTPTFAAAGDAFRLRQDGAAANFSIGDIMQAMSRITVDSGGTALATVILEVIFFDGTTSYTVQCGTALNNVAIGTDGFTIDMRTEKFTVVAKSGSPTISLRVYMQGSAAGAGSAVRIKQTQIRKRTS
jgi:hypothetical protein